MTLRNLLVTTDFSQEAQRAYGCAGALASKFSTRIHLVHVEDTLPPILENVSAEEYFEELEAAVRSEAESPDFQNMTVIPHLLRNRQPFEALKEIEESEKIDLVVTSTHGRTGLERFLLGSFAERVIRTSTAPVLVCRETGGEGGWAPTSVLVPIDFSAQSLAGLSGVRFLASNYQCRFTFLYVHEPIPSRELFYKRLREMVSGTPEKVEERFARLTEDELAGVDATLETSRGVPYREIVRTARESDTDLVLISTHGLLGSVAQNVIREAPCSVLTMRK